MKKIVASVLVASFLITSISVEAQRGTRSGGNNGGGSRGTGGGGAQPSRSFSPSTPNRGFSQQQQPQRTFSQPQQTQQRNTSQPSRSFNQPQRNFNSQPNISQQRNNTQQRNFTPGRNYSSNRNFGTNRNIGIQRNNYYGSRGNFYGSRGNYGYAGGPRFRPIGTYHYARSPRVVISIGGGYSTIPWLGIPYNYYNGYWYRPYGSSFQIITPPIGIHIGSLPYGYSPVYGPWGDYYYYNNVFYRHPENDNSQYEVVDAPLGAQVAELPKGAEVRVIDAVKYYELDGTFYKEDLKDGQIWYTIVGKEGVLSTVDNTAVNTPSDDLGTGDRLSDLPEGSKQITINGQQLYVSPNGNYYQQIIDGNKTWYEVVGQ